MKQVSINEKANAENNKGVKFFIKRSNRNIQFYIINIL